MLKKPLIITLMIIFLSLASYTFFWFASVSKLRSYLLQSISYGKFYNAEFKYDDFQVKGFPFMPKIYINKPQLDITAIPTIHIDTPSLTLSYNLLNNWLTASLDDQKLYGFFEEEAEVNASDKNVQPKKHFFECTADQDMNIAVKFQANTLMLKDTPQDESIINYINTILYRDQGLSCQNKEDSTNDENNIKRVSNRSYIKINMSKFTPDKNKDSTGVKFIVNTDINGHQVTNQKISYYLDVNSNFDFDIISNNTFATFNSKIDNITIKGQDSAINLTGNVTDFNPQDGSFDGMVNIQLTNYKKLLSYTAKKQQLNQDKEQLLRNLIYDISNKESEDNITLSLKYDKEKGAIIGDMPFNIFVQKMYNLYNSEENKKENMNTDDKKMSSN